MIGINWRKAGVYLLLALPVVGVGGIAVIAQQQDSSQQQGGDSLADAARKAREQKKEAPKPKKVFTNEDFGGGTSNSAAQASAPAAQTKENAEGQANAEAAGGEKAAGDKTAPANKNDEESWRKRFKEAREKLATAEKELDILQREAQKAQVQYYSDPQKALAEQYSRKDVNDKDTQIAAKKQEVEQLKQHISDMEDELRRSGGEAGWARE
jgi:chromosome segregation ATPase